MFLEGVKDKTAEMINKEKKGIQKSKSDRSKGRERNLCGKFKKEREGRKNMCVKEVRKEHRKDVSVKG